MQEKRILIVEDEVVTAEICSKHLKARGYDVLIAYDALEAMKKLEFFTPDLILLDLGLPRVSGIDFYEQILMDNGYTKYPVLILTGQVECEEIFREVRVDGFLTKPFSIDRLTYEVDYIIHNQFWRQPGNKLKKVIIVDNDRQEAIRIANTFSQANYRVEIVESGIAAIERMLKDPPDAALFNQNIRDIPADLAVYRLNEMVKTKNIKCVLYTKKEITHEPNQYGQQLREYFSPFELLDQIQVMCK